MRKLLLLLSICMLLLTGCGNNQIEQPAGTISSALSGEPSSLDPALSTEIAASNVHLAMFDGLLRTDAEGNLQPAIAKSWEISDDGMHYTFHLRDNACWSDGIPINAEDFVYSWLRVLDQNTASPSAYMLYFIKNAEEYNKGEVDANAVGIKATDEKTLEVELKEKTPYFLSLTAFHVFYPVPRHIVEKNPKDWASSDKILVSNGPFVLKEWSHSTKIVLMRNEKYWNAENVKPSCIVMPISDSASTRLNFFESGKVDIMSGPPASEIERLNKMGVFESKPILESNFIQFNLTKKPFDNIKLRKAMTLALEREDFVTKVTKTGDRPAYAYVPMGMRIDGEEFRSGEYERLFEENIEEAKKLLAESGYNGETITLLYATSENNKAICEAVQAIWKENLGLNIELLNQESKVWLSSMASKDYDIVYNIWIADFVDPINFLDLFYDPNNDAGYRGAEFLNLVKEAKQEINTKKRVDIMHRAEKVFIEDYVIVPIKYSSTSIVVNPKLKGYIVQPSSCIDLIGAYLEE